MMTQEKSEEQKTAETIDNLKRIVGFLKGSEKYQHLDLLINNLQSMVDGKNDLSSQGNTTVARTLQTLKIAIAHTQNLKTIDARTYSEQDKVTIINDCMELIPSSVAVLTEDIIRGISSQHLTDEERISATRASPRLFKDVWIPSHLFSALFMGEEDRAAEIVRTNPALLFTKGGYKMPLLNNDGTPSNDSEQIYYDVMPLQLMLYTGDWKMWERIFPLVPEAKLEETLQEMRIITHGGADLVKIDRDPSTLSIEELRHYHVKDYQGRPMLDDNKKPVLDDLLHNRNGLFYLESIPKARLFFVDIDPDTQKITVRELHDPEELSAKDHGALQQFKATIRDNIATNSSLRSSDEQHAFIKRLFGVELERNGIHYQLNGKHYQDTHDGCTRLKNAFRRYFEIYDACQEDTSWDSVNAAWRTVVGMAQRFSMVHVIQRFCEENTPFHPLQKIDDLKSRQFIRTDEFNSNVTATTNIYPLVANSGVGFNFGLYKTEACIGALNLPGSHSLDKFIVSFHLAAVRQIDEVRTGCFKELVSELEQRIKPSSDQSSGPGRIVR